MKRLILGLVLLACAVINPMPSFCDEPIDPEDIPRLEPTQWGVFGELSTQKSDWEKIVKNEEKMFKNLTAQIGKGVLILAEMNKNSELYTKNESLGTAMKSIKQLIEYYNESQGVLRKLSNIDQNFYDKFFSLDKTSTQEPWLKNYSEQYYNLSVALDDRFQKSLKSVKITADNINDSQKVMEKIIEASKSPKGRNQILQIRNELLTFMTGEVVEVQTLMMQQFDDYVNFFQRRHSDEVAFSKVMAEDVSQWQKSDYAGKSYTGSLRMDK